MTFLFFFRFLFEKSNFLNYFSLALFSIRYRVRVFGLRGAARLLVLSRGTLVGCDLTQPLLFHSPADRPFLCIHDLFLRRCLTFPVISIVSILQHVLDFLSFIPKFSQWNWQWTKAFILIKLFRQRSQHSRVTDFDIDVIVLKPFFPFTAIAGVIARIINILKCFLKPLPINQWAGKHFWVGVS